jgi:hypothetical protein
MNHNSLQIHHKSKKSYFRNFKILFIFFHAKKIKIFPKNSFYFIPCINKRRSEKVVETFTWNLYFIDFSSFT